MASEKNRMKKMASKKNEDEEDCFKENNEDEEDCFKGEDGCKEEDGYKEEDAVKEKMRMTTSASRMKTK